MTKHGFLALAISGFATSPMADVTTTLQLDLGTSGEVTSAIYACEDGSKLQVRYINTEDNQLAVLTLDDTDRIFVTTISASGARYVSGVYEWWIKGSSAHLSNRQRQDESLTCQTD
jgi:membrane-bound inhibitor of C-type lysozyme